MTFCNKYLTSFFYDSAVTLDNLQKNSVMKTQIAELGFNDARIAEGVSLLNQGQEISRAYTSRRQEKLAKSVLKQEVGKIVRKNVMNNIKRLRKELVDDPETATQLSLQSQRDRTISGFIEQSISFYSKALDLGAGVLEKVIPYGFTKEKLQAGLDEVKRYQTVCSDYDRLQGECQRLIVDRQAAYKALRKWIASLTESCRIACEENPQMLEEIGIFVRNQPKRKKKEAVTVVTPTGYYEHQDIGAAGE